MDALEHLQQINALLTSKNESIIAEVRNLIDGYWEYFHDENKRISQLHSTGQINDSELSINSVAPVVELRGNANYSLKKPYIVWKKHSARFRKNLKVKARISGQPSLSLHSYSTLDVTSILTKHCTWNAHKALELEAKFVQYRVLLNALHENIKKTSATIRSLEKTKAKKEEKND